MVDTISMAMGSAISEPVGSPESRQGSSDASGYSVQKLEREKIAFIDSGRTKKHTALVTGRDGKSRVRNISNLSRLVKQGFKDVYVDQLFPTMYDDLQSLLEAGVRVYRLKRLGLISSFRELNGFDKTDKNDAKVLRAIYDDTIAKFGDVHRRFGEVRLEEVRLMTLLHKYRTLLRALLT